MIALFPFLWLFWQFDLHSFLTDEFLDMINKTKNTNVGNDNLGNVSNEAPGDTEEDDFKDETKEKLESILSALRLDPLRPPTGSLHSTKTFNSSENIHISIYLFFKVFFLLHSQQTFIKWRISFKSI